MADLVWSLDCGAIVDGWHGDAAVTLEDRVGCRRATTALSAGLQESALEGRYRAAAVPGNRLSDISHAVTEPPARPPPPATGWRTGSSPSTAVTGSVTFDAHGSVPCRNLGAAPGAGTAATGGRRAPRSSRMLTGRYAGRPGPWTTTGPWSPADGARGAVHWEHSVAITEGRPVGVDRPGRGKPDEDHLPPRSDAGHARG